MSKIAQIQSKRRRRAEQNIVLFSSLSKYKLDVFIQLYYYC